MPGIGGVNAANFATEAPDLGDALVEMVKLEKMAVKLWMLCKKLIATLFNVS